MSALFAVGYHRVLGRWRTRRRPSPVRLSRGFTLVELLVALALMALMAALSWRGFNSMSLSRQQLSGYSEQLLTLQNGVAQWTADLDALEQQPGFSSMEWDGRALRLLRRSSRTPGEGLYVVAWAQGARAQGSVWMRWQSEPLTSRAQLLAAWSQAALWAQNPGDAERKQEVLITPLVGWQVVFFRGGAWTNALSSADVVSAPPDAGVAAAPADAVSAAPNSTPASSPSSENAPGIATGKTETMPDGVRLVLTLPKESVISGTITRDWSRPGLGAQ